MADKESDKESDYDKVNKVKKRKLTMAEKVLTYPGRVAILGGLAAGKAADQALYNSGLIDKNNPRFEQSTREGRGYEEAKKLGRYAIGLDPIDEPEGKKKGGKVGSASKRADGIAVRGKTRGKMV